MLKKGSLTINSENIFPIIKKWLYSDHDIFLRELVSNGTDAITKLKKLSLMGEFTPAEGEAYRIDVEISAKNRTICVRDNGIGMNASEIDEYINQIAFSGARDFMEKYKDKANEDQIIGHFGLGFYSAFMVADRVIIDTKSYRGEEAVRWESSGGTEYSMEVSDKADRGTQVCLYLNEDSYEFSNLYRVREVLEKYCFFMPVEIYLTDLDAAAGEEGKEKEEETEKEAGEEGEEQAAEKKPEPVNDIHPLWSKHPNECTEEEYKAFYRKVFHDYREPLFWIHLNMDYPFNLKGILYFPKINTEYESLEGVIKLYNNQVFIADNIKEVIPEFLMLLKGVIDCPDLPLNVSRSALQNDGFVKKISDYIAKKVADKLTGMNNTDRENYEKYWDDLAPFIKFGYLKDDKFGEKMKDAILFKNLEGTYESFAQIKADKIYYVTDEKQQSQYINMFKDAGKSAVLLTHSIDAPFVSRMEMQNEDVKFLRIDADILEDMKEEDGAGEEVKAEREGLLEEMKTVLGNGTLAIRFESLKDERIAAILTLSEESRRMREMMRQYGMGDMAFSGNEGETLVLNASHALVQRLLKEEVVETRELLIRQIYDLASLGQGSLPPERMTEFIRRSNDLLLRI